MTDEGIQFIDGRIENLVMHSGMDIDISVPCTIVSRGVAGDGFHIDIIAKEFDVRKPNTWTPGERRAYVAGYCRADSGNEEEIPDRYEEDERRP